MLYNFLTNHSHLFRALQRRFSSLHGYNVGKHTYGNPTIINDSNEPGLKLIVGAFCSFAPEVTIFLCADHRIDWLTTFPFPRLWKEAKHIKGHPTSKGCVIIGNDVWIGRGATILSGVKIGDGAVIGAKAVVTKDVEPYSIVAGNPARHIKFRFSQEIINKLMETRWWDYDDKKIKTMLNQLCKPPHSLTNPLF